MANCRRHSRGQIDSLLTKPDVSRLRFLHFPERPAGLHRDRRLLPNRTIFYFRRFIILPNDAVTWLTAMTPSSCRL